MAIWGQQRRWHPQRISKLGVRETSVAICPTYRQKSQKNPLRSRETAFECQPLGRASNKISYLPNQAAYVVLDIIESFTYEKWVSLPNLLVIQIVQC